MPDERKPKESPYTLDRGIPGAFEGETVTRRRFMTATAHGAGGLAAAAFALPAIAFAAGPVFERQKFHWQLIGPLSDLPLDTYVPQVITIVEGIGEAGQSTVYLRKRNPTFDKEPEDQYNQVIALSTRCMHLGCPVAYKDAAQRFICPCHGGAYDFQGKPFIGPPVRPLDRFYTQIRSGGQVWIGPRYSVNSELRRFSPRDPGQDLDGIGQYLYPARFSTPKK